MIQPESVAATAMPAAPINLEESEAQGDIGHHGDDSEHHRRLGILTGEEARMQDLDDHVSRQSKCQRGEHIGGGIGVGRGEGAVLEQHAHDRHWRPGAAPLQRGA